MTIALMTKSLRKLNCFRNFIDFPPFSVVNTCKMHKLGKRLHEKWNVVGFLGGGGMIETVVTQFIAVLDAGLIASLRAGGVVTESC